MDTHDRDMLSIRRDRRAIKAMLAITVVLSIATLALTSELTLTLGRW